MELEDYVRRLMEGRVPDMKQTAALSAELPKPWNTAPADKDPMQETLFRSLGEAARLLASRQLSPVELMAAAIDRMKRVNPGLNALIAILEESSMEQARRAESELAAGRYRGPLHGIPLSVKDLFEMQGSPTTMGSSLLARWVPDRNANAIERLHRAGAIIAAKANMHEFAMGSTNENPHYGSARNPWNPAKIAGGSSGGSAVAVAAGMGYGSIASDSAGSIRFPAALSGVVGFKPTFGAIGLTGCVPVSWSMDTIGPIARTVEDAALLYNAMIGYDPEDATSRNDASPVHPTSWRSDLRGFRIGICRSYFFEEVSPGIEIVVNRAIERLEELGAHIVEIKLEGLQEAVSLLRTIVQAEGCSFHRELFARFPEHYGADLQYRLSRSGQLLAADYLQAIKRRKRYSEYVLEQLREVDVLAAPVNADALFDLGTVQPEQAILNIYRLSKAPAWNYLGFPSLSVPCGFSADGMPVGLQLCGKPCQEQVVLQVGYAYEQTEEWVHSHIANMRCEPPLPD